MSNKTPAIISALLTIVLLVIFAVLSVLLEMLALNGASESQGMTAMGLALLCQGAGALSMGAFAWWLTNQLVHKFNWNKILAVLVAVVSGVLFGAVISFLSIIISIPIAGVK